jgi:hypothetical protein
MSDRFGHGDKIEATFNPKRLDTLRPECKPFIGKRATFSYCWEIGEGDPKDYIGQQAWMPPWEWNIGWIPTEDLDDISAPLAKEMLSG